MKYIFRRFYLMKHFREQVRDDKNRCREMDQAILFFAMHPKYLFVRVSFSKLKEKYRHINLSVLKNINAVINTPYYDDVYELYKNH